MLSAVSSVQISPNRVQEDCSSVTLDVYPVYEVSPNTTGYVPATALVTPPSSEVSLPHPAPESLPPGVARGISGILGDSRLDGGAMPEPGKRGLVCTLMSMETGLSQFRRRFIKYVHLSLVTNL